MSRPLVILLGTALWVSYGVVVVLHVLAGDWIGPVVSVVVVATGFTLYHARQRMAATA